MGFTLTMLVTGGLPPGSQKSIESLKINVYVPPGFVEEDPSLKVAVAKLVQQFAESIGVKVMNHYDRVAGAAEWPLLLVKDSEVEAPSHDLPIFPPPTSPNSSTYVFWGQPIGQLDKLIAASNGHVSAASPRPMDNMASRAKLLHPWSSNSRTPKIVQYLETIDHLTSKNQALERQVQDLLEEVTSLCAAEEHCKEYSIPHKQLMAHQNRQSHHFC